MNSPNIFLQRSPEQCISRRRWLQMSSLGVLGASMSGWLPALAARANAAENGRQRIKSCILLWLDGRPSQTHTFTIPDVEPDYKKINTSVNGIEISEHLPLLAGQMQDLALIRTMTTGLNNHDAGQYLMHMGYRANAAIDYPSVGSIVARELGRPDTGLPSYINLGSARVPKKFHRSGALGAEYAPMMLAGSSIGNLRPPIEPRADARISLLQETHRLEGQRFGSPQIHAHAASYRKAVELMRTDQTKAFDYKSEPQKIRDMYGKSGFGQQCLQARRLVEAGVAFVEISWGGWDHHGGAAKPILKRSPELDIGFSALIEDLRQRGMLETTLVVWMGEFGRGPVAGVGGGNNHHKGAGHYAKCWTTVLAGAGLKTGQVIGKTSPDAVEVAERPVSAGDFFATICKALEIDHEGTYDVDGRPVPYTNTGSEPIAELF